jgi:glucose-1-phosphate adenylyltransferase
VDENDKEQPYWRDVGTIEAYFDANMDLVRPIPALNLYDRRWPILCNSTLFLPPAKFVFAWRDRSTPRVGRAVDSIVSPGVIISGGLVEHSVISSEVRINSYCTVEESIVLDRVEIGRHSRIRRAIIDKGVYLPEGTTIGFDPEQDRQRFHVSPGGIVVVPKGYLFEDNGPLQVSLLD